MTYELGTRTGGRDKVSGLMRNVCAARISRRRFAAGALGLGLSVPVLGGALSRTRVAFAQDGTPAPVGEQLDLANLSPDIPDPSGPVTITFRSWVDTSTETFQGMLSQFHGLHPTIKVEPVGVPAEQANDKLTTEIAGGNPPDVVYMDAGSVADFASRNALVNLDDYIAKSRAVKPDDYVEAFRASAMHEGSMFGLPIDGESTGLFYRTDLFEAAGIGSPPATWEEFRAAAEKLTDPEKKQYGFVVFAPEAAFYWYPWLFQAGGELLSPDNTEVRFNSEEGKRAAEFYVGLKDVSPPDFLNSNSWDGRVAFAEGKVAMYVAGAWLAGVLLDEFPDATGKWSTAPLPQDRRCATTIAGDILVMPEAGENHDAAWKWMEYLSAPQIMALWNVGTKERPSTLLPPRKSLLDDPRIFENNPILKGFAEQMGCGITNTTSNPNWPAIEQALNDALGRAIYGEISAADALDEAAAEAEDLINQ